MLRRFTSSSSLSSRPSKSAVSFISSSRSVCWHDHRTLMLMHAEAVDLTRTAEWKRRSGARGLSSAPMNSSAGDDETPRINLIDDTTPIDSLLSAINDGEYVLGETKMEHVHRAYLQLLPLVEAQTRPTNIDTYEDYLAVQQAKVRTSNLLLLKRSFWEYDDYRDPYLCRSFGLQSVIFDPYAWNNRLHREFQDYVDRYFAISDHTHLTYFEYCQLLRYFYHSFTGVNVRPALTQRQDKLRPEFGVSVPEGAARVPIALFRNWLSNFQRSLGLHRALVVKGGCGLLPMVTRNAGVRMVVGVDPDPRAVLSATRDARRLRFHDISFKVGSFFPDDPEFQQQQFDEEGNEATSASYLAEHETNLPDAKLSADRKTRNSVRSKFDMVVFAPDISFLQLSERSSNGVDVYAPSLTGLRGELERFFEEAHRFLNTGPRGGIAVILFSNFLQLAYPKEAHPIELEIKQNRRWVLLDYFDHKMHHSLISDVAGLGARLRVFRKMASELRAELWVLHRVEDMFKFGYIHGIPGCTAPGGTSAGQFSIQGQNQMAKRRARLLKEKVLAQNGDWGEYKQRMLRAMQELQQEQEKGTGGGDAADGEALPGGAFVEDEVSQQVRMAVDPTYPDRLAAQARRAVEEKLAQRRRFHTEVAVRYSNAGMSPRERYEQEQSAILQKMGQAESKGEKLAANKIVIENRPEDGGSGKDAMERSL